MKARIMNSIIKFFLAILCIGCVNYLLIYYSDGYFNSSYKETILFIDVIFTWAFCFIFIYAIFYTIKKIYYGNDKCKNFIFDSAIAIIVITVITKILLISFLRSLNVYGVDVILVMMGIAVGIYAYVFALTVLLRLTFKGIEVNYPVSNSSVIRLLKVLHIACLVADLTIIGAFFGIPIFLALWIFQYIFANEKNPFFVFRKYNPKSYQEEDIIDVEVEDEKPKKSLKTFLENWKD